MNLTHRLHAQAQPHHCHAEGCRTPCKPEFLMCPPHWQLVPKKLQLAVWRAHRPGQCDDKKPSREWLAAASAAIEAVRQQGAPSTHACEALVTPLREKLMRRCGLPAKKFKNGKWRCQRCSSKVSG